MTSFSPREIVSGLDRLIVGQHDARRAVGDDSTIAGAAGR